MNEAVLVIDDNADNVELIRILLEAEGFDVHMAGDAVSALNTLLTWRPRLILMDIQLPGMDGLKLTRRLRADPALDGVVIVALSAYAMKSDQESALAVGCDGYITKPINTRGFGGVIREYLDAVPTHCLH